MVRIKNGFLVGKEKRMKPSKDKTNKGGLTDKAYENKKGVLVTITKQEHESQKEFNSFLVNQMAIESKGSESVLDARVQVASLLQKIQNSDSEYLKDLYRFGQPSHKKLKRHAQLNASKLMTEFNISYNWLYTCYKLRNFVANNKLDGKLIKAKKLTPTSIANLTGSRRLGDELGTVKPKAEPSEQDKRSNLIQRYLEDVKIAVDVLTARKPMSFEQTKQEQEIKNNISLGLTNLFNRLGVPKSNQLELLAQILRESGQHKPSTIKK